MAISLECVGEDGLYQGQLDRLNSDLERLVKRLRSLTRHSWASRTQPVVNLLTELAQLAATAENHPAHEVPEIPQHSLGDGIAVIGRELVDALRVHRSQAALAQARKAVNEVLQATR